MITNHIQVSTIELVNVNLGVVVNNFAAPVQSDHKLDECLWHNVEECGAELSEETKKGTFFYLNCTP